MLEKNPEKVKKLGMIKKRTEKRAKKMAKNIEKKMV